MGETLEVRLRRLAAAEQRSREAHEDDVMALHIAISDADTAGYSVRRIARLIDRSPSHTHRIVAGISGPGAH